MQKLRKYMPISQTTLSKDEEYIPDYYLFEELPKYAPMNRLSDSIAKSMRMLADIQTIKATLPGIDCGSCGAPTCRAFAEDIVKCQACVEGCPIMIAKTNGYGGNGDDC